MARIRSIKPDFWTDEKSSLHEPCFVYVVSENKDKLIAPCKVGIAANLLKRFSGLQGGNHRELHMHTKILVCSRHEAKEVEQFCLLRLRSQRMMSEWLNLSPLNVTELLLAFLNSDSDRFTKVGEHG